MSRRSAMVWRLCLVSLAGAVALATCAAAEESVFNSTELRVTPSPKTEARLDLAQSAQVVDFDLWPSAAEAVVLLREPGGMRVVDWRVGDAEAKTLLALPAGFDAKAIATHPSARRFFLLGSIGGQSAIEAVEERAGAWTMRKIYSSPLQLRRLMVAPRPYQVDYDEKNRRWTESYRIFFAARLATGAYSTRSITEEGGREYQAIGPKEGYLKVNGAEVQPEENLAPSAMPAAFHPAGHVLLWQDTRGCFSRMEYARDNWEKPRAVAGNLCGGSLTFTPNGAALLHWQHGVAGVSVIESGGKQTQQAAAHTFTATPSSTPDGRGIVGLVEQDGRAALVYTPIEVPLADVVNAWMFVQSDADQKAFAQRGGLLRTTADEQLYQMYDSESYYCGGYDAATPTRPYLVTTDIFWELVASAYEGAMIVSERQRAMPAFWAFVDAARNSLDSSAHDSAWARAMRAAAGSRQATASGEAGRIRAASERLTSEALGGEFDFRELKPRGHYAADPEMAAYFRAVHYLTAVSAKLGAEPLYALPAEVKTRAMEWIAAYEPYIAPSRAPLVWDAQRQPPSYARHTLDQAQIFPLSWGFDNEVLLTTVFHSDWPQAEQIGGAKGQRLLPSGLDLAAVLDSGYARGLLKTELSDYPALGPALDRLKQRHTNGGAANLYDAWINALAVEWADRAWPGVDDGTLWSAKRLQTGLASWATLRHATVLVNERTVAECGEGGFESVVLRPPRGYVEPNPEAFTAIADWFDRMTEAVEHNSGLTGDLPRVEGVDDSSLPLRQGLARRLKQTAEEARAFAAMAVEELRGEELTAKEYEQILYVGGVAEHDLLVYKSLSRKDLALADPDPMMKIADVAGGGDLPVLEAAVGRPLEWDQSAPFYGRREIVKGSVYSYYEFPAAAPMSDAEWSGGRKENANDKGPKADVDKRTRPAWVAPFLSAEHLTCPAKLDF